MLPHVFVKATDRKWQGREWKVQYPRRSADNVWELQQLASIPACGNVLESQQIGGIRNQALARFANCEAHRCGTEESGR
jgi:hypothetical protein